MNRNSRVGSPRLVAAAFWLLAASALLVGSVGPAWADSAGNAGSARTADPCLDFAVTLDVLATRPFGVPLVVPVGPTCRAAIVAAPDLEASRKLQEMAIHAIGSGGRLGAVTLCDLHAPWAVAAMIRGLAADVEDIGRAMCLSSLAEIDQPTAQDAVGTYLRDRGVQGKVVDKAVADAGERSDRLRARAATVLVRAWDSRAYGFDHLADIVCRTPPPAEAASICDRRVSGQELAWREEPERRRAWLESGAYVLIGGGLAVGGYVARNDDAGRVIAVAAATLAGVRLLAIPLDNPSGGAYGSALASGLRPLFLAVGGAIGLATGLLVTQNPGNSRAATSISASALFTALSIKAAWTF